MSDGPAARRARAGDSHASTELDALADEILPALIARLRASGLAELEVRQGDWRVRLRRDPHALRRSVRPTGAEAAGDAAEDESAMGLVRSPAVGYFSPERGFRVGHSVQVGDSLGSIDVLGISQEVPAPFGGTVSSVLVEAGQAVEYGQVLAEIDPEPPADEAAGSDEEP